MLAEVMKEGRKVLVFALALSLVLGCFFLVTPVSPVEAATDESVVIIAGKSFTMAELKAMPSEYQIDAEYQYNSKGGLKKSHVEGVDLWYLLNTVVEISNPGAKIKFACSDGYPVDPQSRADLANPDLKYVLAWQVDGEPVSDDGGKAQLRIYRQQKTSDEFNTVFKAIAAVEVEDAGAPAAPEEKEETRKIIKLTIGQEEVSIDGEFFILEAAPFIEAGRTLVPVRFISEALGAEVGWDPDTQQVTVTDEGMEIVLTIGSQDVLVDGKEQTIDCAATILPSGRTFVPLRFVSEILGAEVDYQDGIVTIQ